MISFLVTWAIISVVCFVILALFSGYARSMASGFTPDAEWRTITLTSIVIALFLALMGHGIAAVIAG